MEVKLGSPEAFRSSYLYLAWFGQWDSMGHFSGYNWVNMWYQLGIAGVFHCGASRLRVSFQTIWGFKEPLTTDPIRSGANIFRSQLSGGLLYISSDEPKGNERMWGQKWRKIADKVAPSGSHPTGTCNGWMILGKFEQPHRDLTGMMVSFWGNHPQVTLFQVGELLSFTQVHDQMIVMLIQDCLEPAVFLLGKIRWLDPFCTYARKCTQFEWMLVARPFPQVHCFKYSNWLSIVD